MVCEDKIKEGIMSQINAISASNVSFSGRKTNKSEAKKSEVKKSETKEKPNIAKKVISRISQPLKDDFNKKYDGASPTPTLVADYFSDNIFKTGVAILGSALVFAKSRKFTNGLTESLLENARNTFAKKDIGAFKKLTTTLSETFANIKANNRNAIIDKAKKEAEETLASGNHTIMESVKDAILRPVEKFDTNSKLGKVIDKIAGEGSMLNTFFTKNAKKEVEGNLAQVIEKNLAKVGIKNGSSLVDTAIAGAATGTVGANMMGVADNVTSKDNDAIAKQSKIEALVDAADKMANVAQLIGAA